MQIDFTWYDPATGRVQGHGNCADIDFEGNRLMRPGAGILLGKADLETDWVVVTGTRPAIAARPALAGFDRLTIAADGKAAARLRADRPFRAVVAGVSYDIKTPEPGGGYLLEITATIPSRYTVSIDCWPYLPYAAEVVAQ